LPPPDFVVVGHLTRDEHPDGSFTLGGVPTFAAIAARNLGYRVGIVTRAAADFPEPALLHDIEIVRLDSPVTTTFRNLYTEGKRKQYIRDVAAPIPASDIPADWRTAKIALLGPIADELGVDMAHAFSSETLVGISPQGWMRQWDESGRVKPRAWTEAADLLPHVRALILSQEDLGSYTERLSSYILLAPLVALTRGHEGVTIYRKRERPLDVAPFPATPLDPTGAGDSFATAFLIALHETNDVLQAARFANATASLAIEGKGAASMPTREQVHARLNGLT
jgi:1D-myo-inositol 3-kinase